VHYMLSCLGLVLIYFVYIYMEKRNSHEEIDYGAARCHKRLECVK
jgi:hypothetical protein